MTDERTDGGHVVEWLDAWRTGELDPRRARVVEDHVSECAKCHEALADLEAFASTVEAGYRAGEAARPEPDWGARRAAIVEKTSRRRGSRAPWIVRWAPQVAIVAIAVVAVGVLVEKGVRGPDGVERALRAPPAERRASDSPRDAGPRAAADADAAGVPGEAGEEPAREAAAPPPADAAAPPPPEPAPRTREEIANELGEARVEPDPGAVEAPEAPRAEADAGRAAATREAAPDPAERFRRSARAALVSRDTTAARDALAFWADSVEPADLRDDRRAPLEALADSLAVFLSSLP